MKIEIPDDLTGKERKDRIVILTTKYALDKFKGNKTKAAKFLGISVRAIRIRISKYDELSIYRLKIGNRILPKCKIEDLTLKQLKLFSVEFEKAKRSLGYRFGNKSEKERIYIIVLNKCLENPM